MNLYISKSKNSESFYIAKSYVKANGTTISGNTKKNRKNPNDPARFIGTAAAIKAHSLICFLSLMIYRFLEKRLLSNFLRVLSAISVVFF